MSNAKSKVNNALIGAAGVHFVVSELSLRGLIALPTIRNTAGVDVVVVSTDGSWHANLQVKTSKKRVPFWPIGKGHEEMHGENNFYVFVRYLKEERRFEAFLESADRVAQKAYTPAKFGPCWDLPNDEEDLDRIRQQWLKFGPGCFAQ